MRTLLFCFLSLGLGAQSQQLLSITNKNYSNSSWKFNSRSLYSYDANGYPYLEDYEVWNGMVWENRQLKSQSNHSNGLVDTVYFERWDQINGGYTGFSKEQNYYNANWEKDSIIVMQNISGPWIKDTRQEFQYSAGGLLEHVFTSDGDGPDWKLTTKTDYYYNINGQWDILRRSEWDSANASWAPKNEMHRYFDALGNPTFEYEFIHRGSNIDTLRWHEYTYDAQGQLQEDRYYIFMAGAFNPGTRRLFSYNASNRIDSVLHQVLKYNDTLWLDKSLAIYRYGPIVGLTELASKSLIVYPNPLHDILNIEGMAKGEKEIQIFNSSGVLVGQKSTDAEELQLYLGHLRTGLYSIRVHDQGTVSGTSIIKL